MARDAHLGGNIKEMQGSDGHKSQASGYFWKEEGAVAGMENTDGASGVTGKVLSPTTGGGFNGVPPYKNSLSSTFVLWGVCICFSLQ